MSEFDAAVQQSGAEQSPTEVGSALSAWVMGKVTPWRAARDSKHREQWDKYCRLWRGEWASEDKNKKSERSKIVGPATMQAVDSTVAEIEEAVFGREQWFDIDEDVVESDDPNARAEMIHARDLLRELLDEEKVPTACAKAFLIAAVYGTGVGKVNTYSKAIKSVKENEDGTRTVASVDEARVELIALEPYEFVPDPTTDCIEEMLGMAHETIAPFHLIKEGQQSKRYRAVDLAKWAPNASDPDSKGGTLFTTENEGIEGVKITEWHGKVPAKHLVAYMDRDKPSVLELAAEMDEDELLVEAIITIANEREVIGAKPNPFIMGDRCFIAYQHDTIPGYFWGRGVPEKAYNSQTAGDAALRARIDTLALVANPMIAGDTTRLPRGMNLAVWPGKFWPTVGEPGQVLQPFTFGAVAPELFPHSQDMERMVQMATGAMDQSANYSADMGAQKTALVQSAFVKRARRTMQNIERSFLTPLIRKAMWRYVQFSQDFPKDYKFTVSGTLGVMAREMETQQMTQVLSLVPNDSKPFMAMVKAIFDNSSSTHKGSVIKAVDEMINPPVDEEAQAKAKQMEALQMRGAVAEVEEKEAKAMKAKAEAQRALAQAELYKVEAHLRPTETALEAQSNQTDQREVAAFEEQNAVSKDALQLRAADTAIKAHVAHTGLLKVKQEGRQLYEGD